MIFRNRIKWKKIHNLAVNGKTLFYFGGVWNVNNWAQDTFHDQLGKVHAKWVNEHFGMMLYPARKKAANRLRFPTRSIIPFLRKRNTRSL
ncbi:hypothetical protein [Paenibacillus beijingensis]|uniref:Uncharacterized protein n=1 Tax=Paenibacillus beijingensis TaxID=1126833 RepID=A0A0D5NN38_9BACL|nr:hypothetical protein [Paenibacillus beijingensis]AJY76666.1 hypothetical protein VN24_21445 [Paenibacillus beijingensis]